MITVSVKGIAMATDALADWSLLQRWVINPQPSGTPYSPQGDALPGVERRRATASTKLAVDVAQQAIQQAQVDPARLALVFGSSHGDGDTIHHLCETLASPERWVSPTRFHNSVHNAAAGYWSIAAGCREGATSLSAGAGTCAAALLEAACQCQIEQSPVLLVISDWPFPPPLQEFTASRHAFGLALVLDPQLSETGQRLDLSLADQLPETTLHSVSSELEVRRRDSPAARSLPLLLALGSQSPLPVVLPYLEDRTLVVHVNRHAHDA